MNFNWIRKNIITNEFLTFCVCLYLYYIVLAQYFFNNTRVIGGDTQLLWSVHYYAMKIWTEYLTFPWWDQTSLNGFPNHFLVVNGWYNYLHPFVFPSFLLAIPVVNWFKVSINAFLTFQKTIYFFSINLVAVILISREIIKNKWARVFPPLVYALSSFQFFSLRDNIIFEALAPALFYIFGLIYYEKRRTQNSLFVFIVLTGLFFLGLSYPYILSSMWWTSIFTLLMLIGSKNLVLDTTHLVRAGLGERYGKVLFLMAFLFLVTTIIVPCLSVGGSIGEIIRASGEGPLDYAVSSGGQFDKYSVYSKEIWVNLLMWAPFGDIHEFVLKFDPWNSGIDHLYLGLATIPLLISALILGWTSRYVLAFIITAFACMAFIIYTNNNALYLWLLEHIEPLRNTRVLTHVLNRDAPSLMLIFASGIGLDLLLKKRKVEQTEYTVLKALLISIFICAVLMLFCSMGFYFIKHFVKAITTIGFLPKNNLFIEYANHQSSLPHIGFYLLLFTLLALALISIKKAKKSVVRLMVVSFLALVVMDLVISDTWYFRTRTNVWSPNLEPNLILKEPETIGIQASQKTWPGGYRGLMHNLYGGPYIGPKTWLVLASRPRWQTVLENWDPVKKQPLKYPDFRFFTKGEFVPFDRIRDIDTVLLPVSGTGSKKQIRKKGDPGPFYIHDQNGLNGDPKPGRALNADWKILTWGPNRIEMSITAPENGYLVYLDNYHQYWTAFVDGLKVPIYRANFTFKTIKLTPGEHTVKWIYDPFPIKWGWMWFYSIFVLYLLSFIVFVRALKNEHA